MLITKPENITICGGGNAAHVLAALLAAQANVAVYAPFADEAERLRAGIRRNHGIEARGRARTWRGVPHTVSADPAAVFPQADLVFLALPASAHAATLAAAAAHLRPGTWVVVLPARGGFDWEARTLLPQGVNLAGTQTLPWACRIAPGRYGEVVDILGTKAVVDLAALPAASAADMAGMLAALLGNDFVLNPTDFLTLTLANTGQLIHPGIMYGHFHDWDGTPFPAEQIPQFYTDIDAAGAARLQAMSEEVQTICRALEAARPGLDLSGVLTLHGWLKKSYAADIGDDSTLHSSFVSNRAYRGIPAPVTAMADGYAPGFRGRYLLEDVPYGLLATRGIAALAGVQTPVIDQVIVWAQEVSGREWLVGGRISGRDRQLSRAPQRFGRNSLAALLTS